MFEVNLMNLMKYISNQYFIIFYKLYKFTNCKAKLITDMQEITFLTWFLTFMSKCVVHTPYKHCNTTQIARNLLSLLIVALLITVDAHLLVRADGNEQIFEWKRKERLFHRVL